MTDDNGSRFRSLDGYGIAHETWEEAGLARRLNRGLVLTFQSEGKDVRVPLQSGEIDTIDVLTDGTTIYVLSVNYGLGYVGLETWRDGGQINDLFFDRNVEEDLGVDIWDLDPDQVLTRLEPYLQ